ncbi:MAG: SPOR domain-containing protein, partial [Flavobacteriaceae bacterium]
ELSLAYTFKEDLSTSPNALLSSNQSKDAQIDQIVRNYEEQIAELKKDQERKSKKNKGSDVLLVQQSDEDGNALAMENRLILDELIWRQDSIEGARTKMYEKQFETIVRLLRKEIDVKTRERFNPGLPGVSFETATASIDDEIYVSNKKASTQKEKSMPTRKEFKEIPIKNQNRSDIIGVDSGYYLIVNVYSNKRYLKAFVNKLNNEGLNARQFYNRKNGLYYVYLADFTTKDDARLAMSSHLDGDYHDEKWILEIYEPVATAAVQYEQR